MSGFHSMNQGSFETSLPLSLRLVLRDLNGGVQGFRIFIACIVLGVMAIVGVGSIARSLSDGVGRESRRILGGDLSVALMHRELSSQEKDWLQSQAQITKIATLRAMSRTEDGGASALVEIKAVDQAYPNLGQVDLEPAMPIQEALSFKNGRFGLGDDFGRLNGNDGFDRGWWLQCDRRCAAALLDALTHNLRTPLTAIKASVTALIGSGEQVSAPHLSSEGRQDLLKVIDEESDRLNRFIEGL